MGIDALLGIRLIAFFAAVVRASGVANGAPAIVTLEACFVLWESRKRFLPGADFGSITETDAMVSKAIQDTMLKLDPNGAEGAAYTIFAVAAGCAPEPMPEPVRVVFDRPFAFAIFSHSGAPLFVGAYVRN